MGKKMLALFSVLALIVALTGCMQFKFSMDLKNNYIKEAKIQLAFNESYIKNLDREGQELYEYWLEETSQTFGNTDDITATPLYYEENGSIFRGTSYERSLGEDIGYPEEGDESLKIIQLDNNTYRFEAVLKDIISQDSTDEIDMDIEEMKRGLDAGGGKIQFIITTNSKVLSHNADEVINGQYIWDITYILFNASNDKSIAFIEYKAEEDENSMISRTKKEEFIKKYNLDLQDPDFYGKALQKVNVLYGTDKGLELDSELLRLQGALIYARLLGLEDEIEEFAKTDPGYDCGFTDVPAWAKPTMNYLFYNNLVYGKGDNLYGSYDPMSESQFTALVLKALGYSEANKDFVFTDAPKKALELGFFITDDSGFEIKNKDRITRRDMSYIAFNSLFIQNKAKSAHLIENLSIMQ